MTKEDDVLANSFMYVQSDVPEGMTLDAFRRANAQANPYTTNRAYAFATAVSLAIVALPQTLARFWRHS